MTGTGRPARILYVESNLDGTIGGSHYCLLQLVRCLDRARFEPLVLFYEAHALVPRFQEASETLVWDPDRPVQWQSASSWLGPFLAIARRTVNLGRFLQRVVAQAAFLRKRGVDLLHLNNSITNRHDWMLAALLAGVPSVTHQRGMPDYRWLDRQFGRVQDAVIPVSHWTRNHMVEHGVSPANLRVMYDGIDLDRLTVSMTPEAVRRAWDIRPDQPVVGIVGNIRAWKGQEVVVKALPEVVKRHPGLVCMFIGATTEADQPYLDDLQRLIAAAGLQRNVRFTGYQTDVSSLMNLMQIVLHASIAAEPYGMVVLEAMTLRKPVVGAAAGGLLETVVDGETGYTYPPGDSAALAARLIELLDNPAGAAAMGARGRERLERTFSMERFMSDIQTTYQALIDRQPVPGSVGVSQHA